MNLNLEQTKFHGVTYEECLDRERLSGQMLRVWDLLKDKKARVSVDICDIADVSFAALRNRVSDLRVYHGVKIEVKRLNGGLFSYQVTGVMNAQELAEYQQSLKDKRCGTIDHAAQENLRLVYRMLKRAPEAGISKEQADDLANLIESLARV
jgi:hypothetical protein